MIHVGLDLDGCFADFQSRYEELYWPFADPLWDVYDGYKKRFSADEFKRQIKNMAISGDYYALKLYPGAQECWQRIRALPNVKIHVLTHRPKEAWGQTADWLRIHKLDADSLHFTNDKTILKAVAGPGNQVGKLLAIDDYEAHWRAMADAAIMSFLAKRPWNDHIRATVTLERFANIVTSTHDAYYGVYG